MLFHTTTLVSFLLALASAADEKSFCRDLPTEEFQRFIQSDAVRIVYFYNAVDLEEKEVMYGGPAIGHVERGASWEQFSASVKARLLKFFDSCETASRALNMYDVQLARVGCRDNMPSSMDPYCNRYGIGYEVHGFQSGEIISEWAIEHMQGVDALVSNVLQVVLRPNIVSLNTKQDRRDEEIKSRGDKNYVVGFHKTAGNYEHRIFMEVAYAFRKTVNFAATTDYRVVHDLPWYDQFDSGAIWIYFCKEAKPGHPCQVVKYMDSMDLKSLSVYINNLDLPVTYEEADGTENPYEGSGIHQVAVFYNNALEAQVKQDVALTMDKLRGLLGVVLVNVDQTDYGYDPSDKLPTVGLILRGSKEMKFKKPDQTPIQFLAEELGPRTSRKFLAQKLLDEFGGGYYDPLDDYNDRSYDPYVETEDSPIAQEEFRMKLKSPPTELDYTNLPQLTDENFKEKVADADLIVVLFYLYLDVRSRSVLRAYLDAANILAKDGPHPLAYVDCFDDTFVCTGHGIHMYPTIRTYRKGRDYVEYDGVFGVQQFITYAKLNQNNAPVELESKEDARQFIDGNLPSGIGAVTDTAVLGLFRNNQKKDIASFKEAAEQAQGYFLYGLATGDVADQLATQFDTTLPSVVVYKRNDKYQPFTISSIDSGKIQDAANPIFPELTPANFLEYWSMEKPFVLLFTDKSDSDLHDTLGNLVKNNRYPSLIFGWINAEKVGSPGAVILTDFDSTAAFPALAVVDRAKGTVHLKDEATAEGAVQWLQDVLAGNVLPKKLLNQHSWRQPRNPGYNMLKFTDEAEEKLRIEREAMAAVRKTNENKVAGVPLNPEEEELRQDLLQMGADPDHHPTFLRNTPRHTEL